MTHNEVLENLGSLTNVQTNAGGATTEFVVESIDAGNKIITAGRGGYTSIDVLLDVVDIGTIQSRTDGTNGKIYTMSGPANGLGGMKPGDVFEQKGVFNGGRVFSVDYDNNSFESNAFNNLDIGGEVRLFRFPRTGTSYQIGQVSFSQTDITSNTKSIEIAPFQTTIDRLRVGENFNAFQEITYDDTKIYPVPHSTAVLYKGETTDGDDRIWRFNNSMTMLRRNYADTSDPTGNKDQGSIRTVTNLALSAGYDDITPQPEKTQIATLYNVQADLRNNGNFNYIRTYFGLYSGVASNTNAGYYNAFGVFSTDNLKNYFQGNTAIGGQTTTSYKLQVDGEVLIGSTTNNQVADPNFVNGSTGWTLNSGWAANTTPNGANTLINGAVHTSGGGTGTLELTSATINSNSHYRIFFQIFERTAGTVSVTLGGVIVGTYSSDNEYTETITSINTDSLVFTPSNDFDGIIGNIFVHDVVGTSSDNLHVLGNTGLGNRAPTERLDVTGNIVASGTITPSSDERLKTNIQPIEGALEKVSELHGVTFDWKNPANHGSDTSTQVGLIAQEVEQVLPAAVKTKSDEIGTKTVNYNGLTGLLVEAIKELNQENAKLKKTIVEITSKLDNM